ncbi:4-hydroxy-tetrahydrodipicolinate reductase [Catenisphaera adipataccumulans]|uniref:4-hydroxy-tetrahydrodipicolinate reductase n=1 Tax=Catenisphaera adipataccumulans TaxID=700500 RepID=A0A7W8CWC9_9FIRM|nr:4-hydroxy-tetrahydrodipicolinate reductase [Catenisphaera adipataccumulans]MBB5182832.1 4-hydroxy-tetrahydrodipicolinate reductase [Catenisphaera adipataccumulans]
MKILIGGKGRMGSLIAQTAQAQGHEAIAQVDAMSLDEIKEKPAADVLIDFSHRDNLGWIIDYVNANDCALVYGTTGLDEDQKQQLYKLAEDHRVFYSANFSYGVAVLQEALRMLTPMLRDSFDMELVEIHHNQKADAPSGTAKALLEIMDPDDEYKKVYGREGMIGKRGKEIGVHALRGGTEAGEHTVYFFGDNESITITHHATNRQIFVNGALKAANFVVDQPAGLYDMRSFF